MASVSIDEVGNEIVAMVGDFIDEVKHVAEDDVRAAAEKALEVVKETSPRKTGRYGRGWAMEEDAEDFAGLAYRVYNKSKPGLTHLLEHGHGGPHPAGAIPHIAPAAEAGIAELERRMHG